MSHVRPTCSQVGFRIGFWYRKLSQIPPSPTRDRGNRFLVAQAVFIQNRINFKILWLSAFYWPSSAPANCLSWQSGGWCGWWVVFRVGKLDFASFYFTLGASVELSETEGGRDASANFIPVAPIPVKVRYLFGWWWSGICRFRGDCFGFMCCPIGSAWIDSAQIGEGVCTARVLKMIEKIVFTLLSLESCYLLSQWEGEKK